MTKFDPLRFITTTDNTTYHAMIMAKAVIPKIDNKGIQDKRNIYFISLPFQPHCLNFKANIGTSATKSHELTSIPPKTRNKAMG